MVGESPEEQLVEYAALVNVQVIRDFVIPPGREVARGVVGGVESVPASQAHSIGKNHTRDGVSGLCESFSFL